ncbi:hypothetical protein AgCh_033474 [Apium graveolens]
MLKLLAEMLPAKNELPTSTYEAKKILCPMVERFRRLFANSNDAKLVRWHVEGRKSDGMLRHPADSPQWRTIDALGRHSGLVSTDELTTITEEIRKKVQKECEEMMNSKLEGIFNQLKQMGVSLEDDQFVNDVPTLCRLCVIHVERGKVVAARGTLFPTNQGEMIHNNPISPQNVRVSVDDVITEYQLTPLPVPCYEHETIGNAVGSFVQWSKDLVMLGQDPMLEKKKLQEMTPIQKSSKVESKRSVTPLKQSPQVVGDDINSSDHCAGLSFLLKKRPPSKKFDAFIFEENGDGLIYITLEDVNQFLRMSWLNIPIVELFVKYVSKLCKQLKDDKFAFMLPSRLAIPHNHEQQKCKDEATDYMTSLLVANKDKRYILAPYIQEDHWMLLIFCLNESAIYVFDSLKKERKIRLTTPVRMAFKLYVPQGGLKNNRKEFIWHHTEVQCPQQKGGTECGFFVMRVLVLEAMIERKLARYERFGLNFLLLNVYSQGMVLGDTRRECRTITRSLDIIKNRARLKDMVILEDPLGRVELRSLDMGLGPIAPRFRVAFERAIEPVLVGD